MKTGRPCPKCASDDQLYVPGGFLEGQNDATIGVFLGTRFRIARYVCLQCGFTEEWVDRPEDMDTARSLRGNT